MTLDAEQQQAWMKQWRSAAHALAERRRQELQALSEEDALTASDILLWVSIRIPLPPSRIESSGLVQQQAAFHRRGS